MKSPVRHRGFTLIELMISMLLGLLIVGAVMGVMLANKSSFGTNQGLAQVQESARTAYELLAHDIRQADGNGCGPTNRTANIIKNTGEWWQTWFGFTAFDSTQADAAVAIGTAAGERVAGTDSLRVQGMDGTGLSITAHDASLRRLDINAATSDFVAGDIMLVCDYDHVTLFQASASSPGPGTVSVYHNANVGTPGNCSQGMGFPTSCATATGNVYVFPRNAQIGRLMVTDWYIGNNDRPAEGGRSLFRRRVVGGGPPVTEEVVAGVTNMQLQFRATGSDTIIANPSLVADWSTISSVMILLTAQSSDASVTTTSANNGRIQLDFNYLISLRNRLQ